MASEGSELSVLFVCTGNVCRSPFAELLGRHLFPSAGLRLSSAGVGALVGYPVDEEMARELGLRGVGTAEFAARQLSRPMVLDADLVLTMNSRHRDAVLREVPEAVFRVYVLGQFNRIAARLPGSRRGRELVRALPDAHVPPERDDGVPDPRGRGPEAAAAAAQVIERETRLALGRLAQTSL